MPKPLDTHTLRKAISAASKRLPFTSRKQQNEMLGYAADDLADAYRIGASSAPTEIVLRLGELAGKGRELKK